MPTITAKMTGQDDIIIKLNARLAQMQSRVNQSIQGAGIDCEALAKQACPVDTGRLRSSIHYDPGNLSCTVGTNVNYAQYVEFGTYKMVAQPFLFPAFVQTVRNLREELKAMTP